MKLNTCLFLLFLGFVSSLSGQKKIDAHWQNVADYERIGKPKSALAEVIKIEQLAHQHQHIGQEIKALLYRSKYTAILEEESLLLTEQNFKEKIAASSFPKKNILQSMLATMYNQYLSTHQWQIRNRTELGEEIKSEDFRTWSSEKFHQKISELYLASLSEQQGLQKESIGNYAVLLERQENSSHYRPSLFDLLAHEALVFFKNDALQNEVLLGGVTQQDTYLLRAYPYFLTRRLETHPLQSGQLNSLAIYQKLIELHLKNKQLDAMIHVDLERLAYAQNLQILKNSSLLYRTGLAESAALDPASTAYRSYDYQHALTLKNEHPKQAVQMAQTILKNHPGTNIALKTQNLIQEIQFPHLEIQQESHLAENKLSKFKIKHKNTNQLYATTYRVSRVLLEEFQGLRPSEKEAVVKQFKDPVSSFGITTKNEQDYLLHSSEFALPKHAHGLYFLIVQNDDQSLFCYQPFSVSNLALNEVVGGRQYQIIDRTNGQPAAGAKVELRFRTRYANQSWTSRPYKTDKNGFFYPTNIGDSRMETEFVITSNGQTTIYQNGYTHFNHPTPGEHSQNRITLLTDRSIYRPGQTVHFKLIAYHQEKNKSKVLPNLEGVITLKDPNWKDKAELHIQTSEYGSASGSFTLPSTGLNGQYHLNFRSEAQGISGGQTIQVEEYKRPKFRVNFGQNPGTFALNDTLKVVGNADSYAGSTLTEAKVVYRVTRTPQFPRWCHWYSPIEEIEIAHGETLTNPHGEFVIPFVALPDGSIDPKNQPTFVYQITAEVTDLNGETRTGSTSVRVGYHTLKTSLSIAPEINKNKTSGLTISTTNLNNHPLATTGTITLTKLNAPEVVLSDGLWEAPDYQTYTKTEHRKLFPTLPYGNENQIEHWAKGKQYFSQTLHTQTTTTLELNQMDDWPSGYYVVESEFEDPVGGTLKDSRYVRLSSPKDKQLADHQLFEIKTQKDQYQIGEQATVVLLTAAKELYVTVHIEKNRKIISSQTYRLMSQSKKIQLPIKKEDMGGFSVNYSFSYGNVFYAGSCAIHVPYPKSELRIETNTFRNKLDPNQQEQWEFKILGPQGEQVAAELLASMYDMSLDEFAPHQWWFDPIHQPTYRPQHLCRPIHSYGTQYAQNFHSSDHPVDVVTPSFDRLNWFGFYFSGRHYLRKSMLSKRTDQPFLMESPSEIDISHGLADDQVAHTTETSSGTILDHLLENQPDTAQTQQKELAPTIRKNLQETAFFYPMLHTDAQGNISFTFTTPEALTTWKVMLLAYTKDLNYGAATLTTLTQKELMVLPNVPRFVRQGDTLKLETKIANLTTQTLKGTATLELTDALTQETIQVIQTDLAVGFEAAPKGNTSASWTLVIPNGLQALQYRIIARSENFSDGEESLLPVLTNRMLVTESMSLWVNSAETKTFTLDKLKNTNSSTLTHHQVTLEMTSNPAWYALKALPYLMEQPYESAEQVFSRYYSNALARHIVESNPVIQRVFDQWKSSDALESNLEKNPELKSILISETPWLRDAQTQTEQMKRIGLLFDANTVSHELGRAFDQLRNLQQPSGAWSWFEGGYPNRSITQHLVQGFGHLKQLGIEPTPSVIEMTGLSLGYLTAEFKTEYEKMKNQPGVNLRDNHLSSSQLHFLYTCSFFEHQTKHPEIVAYYLQQIEKYWTSQSLYNQGLCALILNRSAKTKTAQLILESFIERSISSQELGMYWKENTNSYHWYQSDIETQALLLEVFSELSHHTQSIDHLKVWLLKNKQTNQWKTTKATTQAVYALLLQGTTWLKIDQNVSTTIGSQLVTPTELEAGSGYFKTSWAKPDVKPELATLKVQKTGDGVAWGAVYWQYFEDLDQITPAKTPLSLEKKLFLKKNSASGPKLFEIKAGDAIQIGDLVTVRVILQSDRNMEFVHMKDMRASGFEPTDVTSGYRWQDELGHYRSTKDASTHFFFERVPKGIYVFEYTLRATAKGNFSNGITSIQSLYAPEFGSHSEGIRIRID